MSHTSVLQELLNPITEAEFFGQIYQQKPIHISGKDGRFRNLFSWPKASDVLNRSLFPHPTAKMNRQGTPIRINSPDQVVEELRKGTTLILDNADSYSSELATFCDRLSYQLLTPVRTNVYMSFPGIQAFDNHYDTHDFFILQTEGKKRWCIFERTVESPLYFAKTHGVEPPTTPPLLEVVLSAGDILYCPKGFWHYAVSTDEPSMHLTLAVFVRTGIDFLNWLIGELREDVAFRREFPLIRNNGMSEVTSEHPYHATTSRISKRLIEVLQDNSLASRFEEYMAAHLVHRNRFSFPTNFIPPDKLKTQTHFSRIGVMPLIRKDGKVKVAFHGRKLELDRRFAGLISAIFSAETGNLDVDELGAVSGCTREEVGEVLAGLCSEGLVGATL